MAQLYKHVEEVQTRVYLLGCFVRADNQRQVEQVSQQFTAERRVIFKTNILGSLGLGVRTPCTSTAPPFNPVLLLNCFRTT